jgi:hypothetical protein
MVRRANRHVWIMGIAISLSFEEDVDMAPDSGLFTSSSCVIFSRFSIVARSSNKISLIGEVNKYYMKELLDIGTLCRRHKSGLGYVSWKTVHVEYQGRLQPSEYKG